MDVHIAAAARVDRQRADRALRRPPRARESGRGIRQRAQEGAGADSGRSADAAAAEGKARRCPARRRREARSGQRHLSLNVMRRRTFAAVAALLLVGGGAQAQESGAAAFAKAVADLGVTARVLVIAAHPDDED